MPCACATKMQLRSPASAITKSPSLIAGGGARREMVAGIAPDGVVLLTWANMHYLDFAMNWVGHMQQLNITAYMIGAMDNELLQVNATHISLAFRVAGNEG